MGRFAAALPMEDDGSVLGAPDSEEAHRRSEKVWTSAHAD